MEAHSLGVGDSFDEALEEVGANALSALVGVLALTLQDSEELRAVSKKPHRSQTLSKAQSSRAGLVQ